MTTTHQSAVVLVPPPESWHSIQAIRRVHDRQFRRWMPHVTLLYPFAPRAELGRAASVAEEALSDIAPFEVRLARFDVFRHRGGTATLWLSPEPRDALVALQAAILRSFPEHDAVSRFAGGFTPHLSVGQARGEDALRAFRAEVESSWTSLTFTVSQVTIIVREPPPDDVFRTYAEVGIGRA